MTNLKSLYPRSAFVGFDHLFDELDRVARHSKENYPPHNIVKHDDNRYTIEMAVAGFKDADIDIKVKDRTLFVSGEQERPDVEYIHKGISAKKFNRSFRLSEYVEVTGADLKDGMLSISLEVIVPDEKRPRKIQINRGSNEETKTLLNESY
jgi:molecular chaperone IbpA